MLYLTSNDPHVLSAFVVVLLQSLKAVYEDVQELECHLQKALEQVSPSLSHLNQSQLELLHNFCKLSADDSV